MEGSYRLNQEDLLKEEVEDLYENAPCGYISILPDRTIAKINNVLLNWLGYTREELLYKKKFTDLITIGGRLYYETHHDPLQRIQGFVNQLNYDLVRKDGSIIPCLLNSKIKKDGNGNILLARTTIFDITERKKYEKELLRAKKEAERAAKAKSQLLSVMSHEIRTPMNAIIGLSYILMEDNPKPEQLENLNVLKNSAENLLNLLNSILDYSKIEAGKAILDEQDFSLQDLLSGLINSLRIKADEKDLEVKLVYDNLIPKVIVSDPVKIGQIFTNLIGNAIKFTNVGSVTINIKLIERSEEFALIKFEVIDTGVGISDEGLNKVFDEYEQAGSDVSRTFGGTGLGLSISKKLVHLFGSAIQVKSVLGKGSTFSFDLNVKISSKVLVLNSWKSNEIKAGNLQGIKLLLAEDNSVNVMVISKFLKNWKLDFEIACNGQEAFEMIIANNYDLVLMDLQMPIMTGYETVEQVRSLREDKYQQLPIIALTASDIIGDNHRVFKIGMNDFVSKPFNPIDLYNKIAKYGRKLNNTIDELLQEVSVPSQEKLLNYDKYRILSEGDNKFLTTLTKETTESFHNYRTQFKDCIHAMDLDAYKKQVHKIKMVSDLLEIKSLEDTLKVGQTMIELNDIPGITKFQQALDVIFVKIITELESHMEAIAIL